MITIFHILKKQRKDKHIKQRLEGIKNLNFWMKTKISEEKNTLGGINGKLDIAGKKDQ